MIINARIESTMLGIEDHGIMTFYLFCEWPGGGGGLGGYALDGISYPTTGYGRSYQAIRQILDTTGVLTWEKLPGTLIRIEEPGLGRQVTKIGHIMEDRWFDLDAYMKALSS